MSPRRRRAVVLGIVLGVSGLGAAVAEPLLDDLVDPYVRSRWRIEDGLPQDAVFDLAQAPDGGLWIACGSGPARFDGYGFRVFDRGRLPALGYAAVSALRVDRRGRLWVGTAGAGALLLSGDGSGEVLRAFGKAEGLDDPRVTAILTRGDDVFFGAAGGDVGILRADGSVDHVAGRGEAITALASAEGGVWIGDRSGVRFLPADGVEAVPVEGLDGIEVLGLAVASSSRDRLWIAHGSGLASWDGALRQLRRHALGGRPALGDPGPAEGAGPVTAVHVGAEGRVWAATETALFLGSESTAASADSEPFRHVPLDVGGAVESLLEDSFGRLWVGTRTDGLHRLERGVFATLGMEQGLSSKIVTAVLADPDGSLWVATRDAGVDRLHRGEIEPYGPAQGLDAQGSWSMAPAEGGGIWLGTDGRGLYRLNSGRARRIEIEGFEARRVFALTRGRADELWVGTNEGLIQARVQGNEVVGLRRLDLADGLPGRQIRALLLDRGERLWVGTVDGLASVKGERVRAGYEHEGAPLTAVYGLHEGTDGTIWIGTFGSGLLRLGSEGLGLSGLGAEGPGVEGIQGLGVREGLFSDQVALIVEDDRGYMWIGGPQGVARLAVDDLAARLDGLTDELPQLVLGRRDGLAGGGVWGTHQGGARGADGRLWIGTHQGLATVDPGRVWVALAPRVRVEEVRAAGRRLELGEAPITLPAEIRDIEIRFAVDMPRSPEKIRLRYSLEGFDSRRQEADGGRRKVYTRLPPGDYAFVVEACDESGRFVGEPARFELRIAEAEGFGLAFYAGLVALVALGSVVVHRRRAAGLERRRQELARRVGEALADVEVLSGLLPICGSCRKVRDDQGFWTQVEEFIDEHSEATFTHGLCPDCAESVIRDLDDPYDGFRVGEAGHPLE